MEDTEKNWGSAFPSGWTWSQGVQPDKRGVCYALAGGKLLGVKTIMLVLRLSNGIEWNFRPPATLMLFNWLSFGFREELDKQNGVLKVSVNDMYKRVVVQVTSIQPVEDWLSVNTPAADGQ